MGSSLQVSGRNGFRLADGCDTPQDGPTRLRALPREDGILTPEDHDRIADAVRQGMRPKPGPIRSMLIHFAFAIVALVIAVWSLGVLQDWRLPVDASMSTTSLESIDRIHLSAVDQKPFSWRTSADAAILDFEASAGEEGKVDLELPISSAKCIAVAEQLGAECVDNRIRATNLEVTWNQCPCRIGRPPPAKEHYFEIPATAATSVATFVDRISGPDLKTPIPDLGIEARPAAPVAIQLSGPGDTVTVEVTSDAFDIASSSDIGDVFLKLPRSETDPYAGVPIEFRSVPPSPMDLGIGASGVKNFALRGWSPVAEIQDYGGILTTSTGGRQVISPPAHLSLVGDGSKSLPLQVNAYPLIQQLKLYTAPVRSATVDNAELISAVWNRYSAIVIPIWSGLFGILVLSEFGTVIRGLWSRSGT